MDLEGYPSGAHSDRTDRHWLNSPVCVHPIRLKCSGSHSRACVCVCTGWAIKVEKKDSFAQLPLACNYHLVMVAKVWRREWSPAFGFSLLRWPKCHQSRRAGVCMALICFDIRFLFFSSLLSHYYSGMSTNDIHKISSSTSFWRRPRCFGSSGGHCQGWFPSIVNYSGGGYICGCISSLSSCCQLERFFYCRFFPPSLPWGTVKKCNRYSLGNWMINWCSFLKSLSGGGEKFHHATCIIPCNTGLLGNLYHRTRQILFG